MNYFLTVFINVIFIGAFLFISILFLDDLLFDDNPLDSLFKCERVFSEDFILSLLHFVWECFSIFLETLLDLVLAVEMSISLSSESESELE